MIQHTQILTDIRRAHAEWRRTTPEVDTLPRSATLTTDFVNVTTHGFTVTVTCHDVTMRDGAWTQAPLFAAGTLNNACVGNGERGLYLMMFDNPFLGRLIRFTSAAFQGL